MTYSSRLTARKRRRVFTGIVEEIGRVSGVDGRGEAVRLRIAAGRVLDALAIGDSIAVDGVCQTVVDLDAAGFALDSIATTLSRTTLGSLIPGDEVNLERALALGDRLGGHLVQGHVDGVGTVVSIVPAGAHVLFDVQLPEDVAEVTVLHGSITIDGVSLTVNALPTPETVQVALIPHTWQNTTLQRRKVGDPVNLEGDLFGKFVVHYLKRRPTGGV
jgi:riboflavin synthase